jgi:hypothetical protein
MQRITDTIRATLARFFAAVPVQPTGPTEEVRFRSMSDVDLVEHISREVVLDPAAPRGALVYATAEMRRRFGDPVDDDECHPGVPQHVIDNYEGAQFSAVPVQIHGEPHVFTFRAGLPLNEVLDCHLRLACNYAEIAQNERDEAYARVRAHYASHNLELAD